MSAITSQRAVSITVGGIGDNSTAVSKGLVDLVTKPRFESNLSYKVEALVLKRISNYSPPKAASMVDYRLIDGLKLADPSFDKSTQIDMLLGASVHAKIEQGQIIKGQLNQPIAIASSLGWLLSFKLMPTTIPPASRRFTSPKILILEILCRNFGGWRSCPPNPYSRQRNRLVKRTL